MAFEVITDNGRADAEDHESAINTTANAYVSLADFLSYHADRNMDYSDYEPEAIQAAIVKATDYMERRHGRRFKGRRIDGGQALSWPRIGVYSYDGYRMAADANGIPLVPTAVRNACAEYAARELLGTALMPDPSLNRNVMKTVNKVGPITDETHYAGSPDLLTDYPAADMLLSDYVTGSGGGTYR